MSESDDDEPRTPRGRARRDAVAPATKRRRWPQIRASLIGFTILVGLIDGCPLPPNKYVTWQKPIVDVVRPIQQKILAPLKWVTFGVRFTQRWALMQAAARERFRFTVEGRAKDGTWSVIYRANDPDHDAFADMLETHHAWGVWNPTDEMMGQYKAFIKWFTGYVLDERPDLTAVRTFQEKVIIEDGELKGTGERTSTMTRERGPR